MKLVVIRENLRAALAISGKAEGINLHLPILRNCLIEVAGGGIHVIATNLELAIRVTLTGKVIEQGKFTLPIKLLSDILGTIKSERLNLERKGKVLIITTDNYEATLRGIEADEFPPIPKVQQGNEYIEIGADVLLLSILQVLASVHVSEVRPELNNVLFDISPDALKLTTTDSFRLSEKTISSGQFTSTHSAPRKLLIPIKTTQTLASILKKGEVVRIYHDDTQALFTTGGTELLSRLSEGSFPDYSAILPGTFATEIVVDREEFAGAVRAAGVFGSKNNEAKFRTHENKKLLEVLSADQSIGENRYLLPARIKGKSGETAFNWKYIMDALKVIQGTEVLFGVNGDNEPSQIKSATDASYFYILKPIAAA